MAVRVGVNNSMLVVDRQVKEIMAGDLPDPTESTLGSRLEAVMRLDGEWVQRYGHRPRAEDLAAMLGVQKRTVERYRAKIRAFTLG
jgi:hypothetical protein